MEKNSSMESKSHYDLADMLQQLMLPANVIQEIKRTKNNEEAAACGFRSLFNKYPNTDLKVEVEEPIEGMEFLTAGGQTSLLKKADVIVYNKNQEKKKKPGNPTSRGALLYFEGHDRDHFQVSIWSGRPSSPSALQG